MLLKVSIALLTSAIALTSFANTPDPNARLFLVGGGLKTCSSMSLSNCKDKSFSKATDKSAALYQVTQENINLLSHHWPNHVLPTQKKALLGLLNKMAKSTTKPLNKSQLRKLWQAQSGSKIINQLADREYYLMLDALEVVQLDKNKRRITENVSLKDNKNPFSVEVFQQFTALATQKAQLKKAGAIPHILVVTASARDPYEAVDFYTNVFQQTGAKVTWLPIDGALNTLWQAQGATKQACALLADYQASVLGTIKREQIYPELFNYQQTLCETPAQFVELIRQADGIFINGGDQSLTKQAFKQSDNSDNKLLAQIRDQIDANQLVIGGTSAGTAVMSGGNYQEAATPMITNGRSEVALVRGAKADVLPNAGCQKAKQCAEEVLNDDLTYNSQGGLALFPWGIMDTHFSERGREGRLVQLTRDTNTTFGFGVDEATAMQVSWHSPDKVNLNVIGQSGVFIVEHDSDKKQILSHYLTRDDRATLSNEQLTIEFAHWKQPHSVAADIPALINDVFVDNTYQLASNAFCLSDKTSLNARSNWQSHHVELSLVKDKGWRNAVGAINSAIGKRQYCSYAGLAITIAQ